MSSRPTLNKEISLKDFRDFYWLKKELTDFCRNVGIPTSGSKTELAQRVEYFLTHGAIKNIESKPQPKSKFDWKNAPLLLSTEITDNYKNTENVRSFFEKEIGKSFKFNVKFMNWMKVNIGKTLGEAIKKWKQIKQDQKENIQPKEIAPQFEYNTYLRDFLADNPKSNRKIGIAFWKIKKSKRGDNVYRKSDLKLLKKE